MICSSTVFAGGQKRWFRCSAGPAFTHVGEKWSTESYSAKNGCQGSVKIQGIQAKCAPRGDVSRLTSEFFRELVVQGREKCESFCKKRSRKCKGQFLAPTTCAFSLNAAQAVKKGKVAGCHDNCEGNAYAYCSLYRGSFLKVIPKQFEDKSPNCLCSLDE